MGIAEPERKQNVVNKSMASRCHGVFAEPDPEGDDIHAVLRRVTAAQPEIFLSGHEGYYRHSDIATLIHHVTPPKRSLTDFDEWCDALGRAARDDYTAVPHSVLAKWFTRGDSVDVAVGNFIDYRLSHPA